MLIERMRKRLAADQASFIEPCLPSPAEKPPSGSNWIHEIKHDGFRLMARRDPVGIRPITRRGNDWTQRYPLVAEAVNHLNVRSCLIDGEVVCCDERGLAIRLRLPWCRVVAPVPELLIQRRGAAIVCRCLRTSLISRAR
jgi:ATP-dependent DNA ligase